MGKLQKNGLMPWRRPALLVLLLPMLYAVASGFFARSKQAADSSGIASLRADESPGRPANESAGARSEISPAQDARPALPKSHEEDRNPGVRSVRVAGEPKRSEKATKKVIPPPRSWGEPAKKRGGEAVKVDRLPVARDRAPAPLKHDFDRQVVRAAASPGPAPKAAASVIGLASPGLKITLNAAEQGNDLHVRWIQIRGPRISTNRLDQPRLTFTVPGDAKELAFLLVVYGPNGSDSTVIDVPLLLRPKVSLPPQIFADAGDDQIGLVGHEITLNGARSSPLQNAAFRWIQAEGPRVASMAQDGWFCSFIPTEPGVYRFILVVAADGTIAEPDDVRVTITNELEPGPERSPALAAKASLPPAVDVLARQSLCSLPGGVAAAPQLANAFEDVARRMDLYESYSDVQHEMSLRLNMVLPADPTLRAFWNERLFDVLSFRIADMMRREGLDLTANSGLAATMTESQKNQLRDVFNAVAAGFRKASSSRSMTGRPGGDRPSAGADQVDRSTAPKVEK